MAIRKVARLGHPVLRQRARELSRQQFASEQLARLVADMRETMVEYGGVGLAAPQVHEPVRVALIEFDADNERYEIDAPATSLVVINPVTTVLDDTVSGFWEGCLSVPGMRGYVERPSKVRVDYLNEHGEARALEASGFLATVVQHELDHLDGVLYVDKLADPAKLAFIEEYQRYHLRMEHDT